MRFGEYVEEESDGEIVIDYIRAVKHQFQDFLKLLASSTQIEQFSGHLHDIRFRGLQKDSVVCYTDLQSITYGLLRRRYGEHKRCR